MLAISSRLENFLYAGYVFPITKKYTAVMMILMMTMMKVIIVIVIIINFSPEE